MPLCDAFNGSSVRWRESLVVNNANRSRHPFFRTHLRESAHSCRAWTIAKNPSEISRLGDRLAFVPGRAAFVGSAALKAPSQTQIAKLRWEKENKKITLEGNACRFVALSPF
jgi:hypothetical protein